MRLRERVFFTRAAWIPSAAVLLLGVWTCLGPEVRLAYVVADDSYYYFNVAKHLAHGNGSTFDGLNVTNGYHPLWCWLLVPVFWFTDDPGIALRVIGLAWFLLAACLPPALYAVVTSRSGPFAGLVAAALCLHPWIGLVLSRPNGLETPLLALCIVAFVGAWERVFSKETVPSAGRFMILGALLGATILARMDAGFLAVVAAVVAGVTLWRRAGLSVAMRSVAALTLGAILVAGPSLAWNTVVFGSPVPISGRVVSAWDELHVDDNGPRTEQAHLPRQVDSALRDIPLLLAWQGVLGTPLAKTLEHGGIGQGSIVLALAIALAVAAVRLRWREGPPGLDAVGLLVMFAATHFVVYAFFFWTDGERVFRIYYFLPQALAVFSSTGVVMGRFLEARVRAEWIRFSIAAIVLAGSVGYLAASVRAHFEDQQLVEPHPERVADWPIFQWIGQHTPDDAVLASFGAGRFGFFSGRTVVNLDGLINGTEFLRAIREDRIDRFVAESPIEFVVSPRSVLHGFDASAPEVPPKVRSDLGELGWRLANHFGYEIVDVPGVPEDWAVLQIRRQRSGSRPGVTDAEGTPLLQRLRGSPPEPRLCAVSNRSGALPTPGYGRSCDTRRAGPPGRPRRG